MIRAASGSFPSLSSPSFFCPLRLAVCTFCFVPGPVSHALDILLFNLPDTYHKIAIKNLVFLKKRGGEGVYQPECIRLCFYQIPCTELQGSHSVWHLGIWADRSIIFMGSHEHYGNGNEIWLSLLPPTGDILLTFHWSNPVLWSQQPSKC